MTVTFPYVSGQVEGMIKLQLACGCRPGEACIMRGCDLDATGKVWAYRPEHHKTEHHGHARVICLGPQAQEIIKSFLTNNLQAYLFSPAQAEAERRQEMPARPPRQRRQSRSDSEVKNLYVPPKPTAVKQPHAPLATAEVPF